MIQIKAGLAHRPDRGNMPMHPVTRDVVVVVAVKLAIVIAAALFVFGPAQRPRIDVGAVRERMIGDARIGPPSFSQQSRISAP